MATCRICENNYGKKELKNIGEKKAKNDLMNILVPKEELLP